MLPSRRWRPRKAPSARPAGSRAGGATGRTPASPKVVGAPGHSLPPRVRAEFPGISATWDRANGAATAPPRIGISFPEAVILEGRGILCGYFAGKSGPNHHELAQMI